MPRKRLLKKGGRLAHQPMGCERMAVSVSDFSTSLANAGKMPALLEAGASRMNEEENGQVSRAPLGMRADPALGKLPACNGVGFRQAVGAVRL